MSHHTIPADLARVSLRFLKAADHAAFIALERDADVREYVNGPSTKSDGDFLHGLRAYTPTTSLLVIADPNSDAFLGRCGLRPVDGTNEVELFLLLEKSSQRKGIGESVLRFLIQLARSEAKEPVGIVHPENQASQALLKKVGMSLVGTVSSNDYQNGHLRYVATDG